MRQRKPANLAYDLERFGAGIVEYPERQRGAWAHFGGRVWREVRLDLGCGKGTFLVAAAQHEPDVLFVGVDSAEVCVARAAQKVVEAGVSNAVAFCADGRQLQRYFGAGELSRIYLNFNTPFPKRKYAEMRLTHLNNVMRYRDVLAFDGLLDFRTDNVLYWEFTLGQLVLANYTIVARSDDIHADTPEDVVLESEYDDRMVANGARVRWLQAVAAPFPEGVGPEDVQQTMPLGLVEYLPANLDEFDEVPYGMESTLENMRNYRTNRQRHEQREQRAQKVQQQCARKSPDAGQPSSGSCTQKPL